MEPARSVSRLAQRERGKPEELATRDGPERLDERRERGRASGEAADDRAATRERSHASDGAGGLSQQPPGRGGEGVEPRVGHHDERAEVRVILGEAEPLHRPRRRQHEPVVEDQAAAVTHGDGALEEREPPRLAARDAPRGEGVREDQRGAVLRLAVDGLTEGRARGPARPVGARGERDAGASRRSWRIHERTASARSPVLRFVKTKGRPPRIRRASRSMTARSAPTWGARSILLMTSRSERVMPGPPLRGIFSPSATSMT